MKRETFDVVVIGGGSAGLMAALVAAEAGARVCVLEKNESVGQKLAITGGGRCNIMNGEEDVRLLLSHYSEAAKFLHSPFASFGPRQTRAFFESRGLPLVEQARQRVFPKSERASDVVAFFAKQLAKHNVSLCTGEAVTTLDSRDGLITAVHTTRSCYTATAYILATGGLSHPETGSTGDGLTWLATLGHTIHRPNPALVPLVCPEAWVQSLAGTSLPNARITFRGTGSEKATAFGRILFTHFGLSGPAVLNAAAAVAKLLSNGPVSATLDLFPGIDDAKLQVDVQEVLRAHHNKAVKNLLKYLVPLGLSGAVGGLLPSAVADTKANSLTRPERQALIALLRALPLSVTGTKGNDWAVVSNGGLDLTEVDTKTMRSKKIANLYVIGDVLHINRPSGGYSLQLCWSTGAVAGEAAARLTASSVVR